MLLNTRFVLFFLLFLAGLCPSCIDPKNSLVPSTTDDSTESDPYEDDLDFDAGEPDIIEIDVELDTNTHESDFVDEVEDLLPEWEPLSEEVVVSSEDCPGDSAEPNNSFSESFNITEFDYHGLTLCDGDEDWFQFIADRGQKITFSLIFTHRFGDLDMVLYDYLLNEIGKSDSSTSNEFIIFDSYNTQPVYLKISGYRGAVNRYDLLVASQDSLEEECEDDPQEPNDFYFSGTPLTTDSDFYSELILCPQNEDWFAVSVEPGGSFEVQIVLIDEITEVDLELFRVSEGELEFISHNSGGPVVRVALADVSEEIYLRVYGAQRESEIYHMGLRVLPPFEPIVGQVTGKMQYKDKELRRNGFGFAVDKPITSVMVELVRSYDDNPIAQAICDNEGEYSLEYVNRGPSELYVRMLSEINTEEARVRVVNRFESQELYAVRSDSFDSRTEPIQEIEMILEADSDVGGAFNILAASLQGFSIIDNKGLEFPMLTYIWEKGTPFSCGSCYGGDTIQLGGGAADPDEFDDPVILHEFGHYITDNFSLDSSPGGTHNGSRTEPTLAYGEGIATFLSSVARNNATYLDYRITGVMFHDLEGENDPESYGTEGNRLDGEVSEYLVGSLLWDLFDDGTEEFDHLVTPRDLMLSPLWFYLPQYEDRGYEGVDLVDWLDGWFCLGLNERLQVQEILENRRFPYDFPELNSCTDNKPQNVLTLNLEEIDRDGSLVTFALTVESPRQVPAGVLILKSIKGLKDQSGVVAQVPALNPGKKEILILSLTTVSDVIAFGLGVEIRLSKGLVLHDGVIYPPEWGVPVGAPKGVQVRSFDGVPLRQFHLNKTVDQMKPGKD